MTKVTAICGPLYTSSEQCPLNPKRACWYEYPCLHYEGTTKDSRKGYGPVTVMCSAPTKKGKSK